MALLQNNYCGRVVCKSFAFLTLLIFIKSTQICGAQNTHLIQNTEDIGTTNSDPCETLEKRIAGQLRTRFERLEESLISIRERTTDCNCRCEQQSRQANCTIFGQSYSGHNTLPSQGFLRLNGREIWSGGWLTHLASRRGINIFAIDPFTCTRLEELRFDTWENAEPANDLVAYLEHLHDGVVVVGISGDEPTRFIRPALRTLGALGVSLGDVLERGNFAFVLQKGYSWKTTLRKSPTHSLPGSSVNIRIRGTSVDDLAFTSP